MASVALGWSLTVQMQQEQSIHTSISVMVWEMGQSVLGANGNGESFLDYRTLGWNWTEALNFGWLGAVGMSDAANRARDLNWVTDGPAVVDSLHLFGLDCVAQRYESIVELAESNPSIINGTNGYALYFGSVVNLTWDLGWELSNISQGSGGAPPWGNILDRLNASDANAIRANLAALYIAGTDVLGSSIWSYACG